MVWLLCKGRMLPFIFNSGEPLLSKGERERERERETLMEGSRAE